MSYTPRNPPANANELSGFLAIELQKIAQEWSQPQPSVYLSTSYAEPTKPREGMIAKADGTTWNPGSGSGVYCYIAGAWVLLQSNGRELLTTDRTYYVRTDGSDSNNGLTDTAGGAFLTLQKAVDFIAFSLDIAIFDVTINCGNGSRTAPVVLKKLQTSSGSVYIVGDDVTPSNCTITTTGQDCFRCADFSGPYIVSGFKLSTVTSGSAISATGKSSVIRFKNIDFGACASAHIQSHVDSFVEAVGNYSISGSAPWHCSAFMGGSVSVQVRTVTITGTPAFSYAFAVSQTLGIVVLYSNTYSGTATGQRYNVSTNAIVKTDAGVTVLPGNVAGTTATGGQYA